MGREVGMALSAVLARPNGAVEMCRGGLLMLFGLHSHSESRLSSAGTG